MFFPKSHGSRASFVKIDMQWPHTSGRARISTRTFHISWPIWLKFGKWDLHTLPAMCRTNRYSENGTLPRGVKKNHLPSFAHFLSDVPTVPHRQYPQSRTDSTHSPAQTVPTVPYRQYPQSRTDSTHSPLQTVPTVPHRQYPQSRTDSTHSPAQTEPTVPHRQYPQNIIQWQQVS
jgi:hypothetical protein